MNPIIIVLIIILVFVALAFGIGYGFFAYSILRVEQKPQKMDNPNDPWTKIEPKLAEGRKYIESLPYDEWNIKSNDGLKLWGRFVPAYTEDGSVSKNVILMMHGYHCFNNNDFAVSFKYFHEAGYTVLLPNQRSHGKSEGKYITFGLKEREDCKLWAEEIVSKLGSDVKISLMGVSMGCATVTMALGLDLPKQVKCCISDCGYTSPADEFRSILHGDYHLPDFPFMYTQKFYCKHLADFDIDGCSTLDVLKTNKRPVFFIHGGKDTFVPTYMGKKNYEACTAPKELLIIDDAVHAQSFDIASEKCWERVSAFLDKYLVD
jgi:uncharacterized protein